MQRTFQKILVWLTRHNTVNTMKIGMVLAHPPMLIQMTSIIIRGFNSVNSGFSVGGEACKIRQPVARRVWQIGGWGGQQHAAWRYGIPISRMDRKIKMIIPAGCWSHWLYS